MAIIKKTLRLDKKLSEFIFKWNIALAILNEASNIIVSALFETTGSSLKKSIESIILKVTWSLLCQAL